MKKILFLVFFISSVLFSYDATIDIVKKSNSLPTIMVQDASPDSFLDKNIENKIFKMIIGDLKVSSNFIVDNSFVKTSYDADFKNNKQIDLILRFKLKKEDNALISYVKLINVKNNNIIIKKIYKIKNKKRYPFLSHAIVIDVNNAIGAPSIDWMQKFIVFAKYTGKRKSDIVISDYTLTYQKTIVTGGLNIFPKWADKEQNAFYYTSYNGRIPTLYRVDLSQGTRKRIVSSPGMLVCSDVSQDGSEILLTMAPNDQPDIYLYDVSGHFIDNETRVAFVSDRLGYPNIFAKKLNINAPVEQLIYQGKNNDSFSAYDHYIVFSRREKDSSFGENNFNLYLISTKTEYVRQLTATGKNYFPRFANKGETVMFIKNYQRQSALGIIRLNANKTFLFPLKVGKIQSIDW